MKCYWCGYMHVCGGWSYHQKTLPEAVTAEVRKEERERWATISPSSSGNTCAECVSVCTSDGITLPGMAEGGGEERGGQREEEGDEGREGEMT